MDRVAHATAKPAVAAGANPSPPVPPPPTDDAAAAFDATGETPSDGVAADEGRRAEALLVAQHLDDETRQIRLDRVRAAFDADQAESAEYQREMNVLRDMALEQQKHDDEILKKWIALI